MSIPKPVVLITSILAFSSPSLAASDADAELGKVGDKMSAAFRCSFYASYFDDKKERHRLFQVGLRAGRDLVEKSDRDEVGKLDLPGASTDFVVGLLYASDASKAYDEIYKYEDGLPLKQFLAPPESKAKAELIYRKSNCSLIQ